MTPEARKDIVIAHEGQALMVVGSAGRGYAAEMAMAVTDGLMNALVRMEGSEAAAKFAFALADRVAGGVREPTNFQIVISPSPAVVVDESLRSRLRQLRPPKFCGFWWVAGLVAGLAIAAVLRGAKPPPRFWPRTRVPTPIGRGRCTPS